MSILHSWAEKLEYLDPDGATDRGPIEMRGHTRGTTSLRRGEGRGGGGRTKSFLKQHSQHPLLSSSIALFVYMTLAVRIGDTLSSLIGYICTVTIRASMCCAGCNRRVFLSRCVFLTVFVSRIHRAIVCVCRITTWALSSEGMPTRTFHRRIHS